MRRAFEKYLLFMAVLLFPLHCLGAEAVKFKHVVSIYVDEKGGSMRLPEGVACDDKSRVVVADTGNGRLLRFTFQDGTAKGGAEIKVPQLIYPVRVQMNSKGEIFALDGKERRIVRLNPEGAFAGYVEPQGVPEAAAFVPRSFKVDSGDNIYILDILSNRVLVLDPAGKFQRQIPFPEKFGFFSDLAVNAKGDVLLIDSVAATVSIAAKGATSFTPLTKEMHEYMDFPTYITTDKRGMIYLVDQNGDGIITIGQDGSFQGRQLSLGWKDGLLYYPSQVCMNGAGNFFIADRNNSRVQVFEMSR